MKNIALVGYERGASGALLIPIQESEISCILSLLFKNAAFSFFFLFP